jgi:hypothetical protein
LSVLSRGRLSSQRKLRQLVSRFKGCLSSLAPRQTEVLVLRSGFGLKHAYGRRQVARILHVSLPQEGKIERHAVAGLNGVAAGGRCASTPTSIRTTVARTVGLLVALTNQVASTGNTPSGVSTTTARRHVTAHPRNSARPTAAGRTPTSRFRSAAFTPPEGGSLNWLFPGARARVGPHRTVVHLRAAQVAA